MAQNIGIASPSNTMSFSPLSSLPALSFSRPHGLSDLAETGLSFRLPSQQGLAHVYHEVGVFDEAVGVHEENPRLFRCFEADLEGSSEA
jgi:hypothetical protein